MVLACLTAASGLLLLFLGSKLTFLLDDWEFLVYRRGFNADVVLQPHGEHIVVLPVLAYKALLAIFGMSSALPFRAAAIAFFLLSAVLLFVFLERRLGQWLALILTAVVLFLGAAWEDLLWPFQIGYFGATAAGLGALLGLERGGRRGDAVACLLLTVSILFSSLGLPFAFAATVHVLWDRERWRRLYVCAVPLAVYVAWWIGWGHTAESAASLANLLTTPVFAGAGVSANLAALFGLGVLPMALAISGLAIALLVAAAAPRWWPRIDPRSRWLWVTLVPFASFWTLSGINQEAGRSPDASRYQYVGVVLGLLFVAELLRGLQLGRRTLTVVGAVGVVAILGNLHALQRGYKLYHAISRLEKADLGAVEIAEGTVEPTFVLSEDIADTAFVHIDAWPYLLARDEFGSPAYTPAEIAAAPLPSRRAADKVLAAALRVELRPIPAAALPAPGRVARSAGGESARVPAHGCLRVAGDGSSPLLALPPGGVALRAGPRPVAGLRLGRFAPEAMPVDLGEGVAAGRAAALRIPRDSATRPWKLRIEAGGPTTVCGIAAAL